MDIRRELERIIDTRNLTDKDIQRLWIEFSGKKDIA
jgi:hypothetical protein